MPRVEVDSSLTPVELPARIVAELFGHARETLPEECCGLILGSGAGRYEQLVRCGNRMTQRHREDPRAFPLDGKAAFWMNPADYLPYLEEPPGGRAPDESGRARVTAVYHSHVGTEAYLSETDLEYANHPDFPFRDADQIVVSLASPEAEHVSADLRDGRVRGVALFQRHGGEGGFRGRAVSLAAA